MNNIKIKFDPFQEKCTIALNGEPLSKYSELNKHVNKSLLASGRTLLEDIGGELNDEYDLTVVGTDFEKFFAGDLKQRFADCKTLSFEMLDIKQRYEEASKIMTCATENYKEKVYADEELEIEVDHRFVISVSNVSEATICVAANMQQAKEFAANSNAKLILYVAEKPMISYMGDAKCFWGTKPILMPKRLQAAVERFAIPRYLQMAEQQAQEREDETVIESVETLKSIDVCVSVSVASKVVEGDVLTPAFTADAELPTIRMESANPQVIQVRGKELLAVGEGKAKVWFYKESEIDAFETVEIHVKADTFLKEIRLLAPEEMKPGRAYQIGAAFVPADSPEIGNVQWSIEDPTVAEVDAEGNLRTLKAGTTVITAQAERTAGQVQICVVPGMEKLVLSEEKVTVGIARYADIGVTVEPVGCKDKKIVCKSTNPSVAVAEKNEFGQWKIKGVGVSAKGEGNCKLIFSGDEGRCTAVCDVTVVSSLKTKSKNSGYLSRTAFLTLIAFVLQFFGAPLGTFGPIVLGALAVACGIYGIIRNWRDAIWEILLVAISIWIVIGTFGRIF